MNTCMQELYAILYNTVVLIMVVVDLTLPLFPYKPFEFSLYTTFSQFFVGCPRVTSVSLQNSQIVDTDETPGSTG